MRYFLAGMVVLGAGIVFAEAPLTSVRPKPRPTQLVIPVQVLVPVPTTQAAASVRPRPRPSFLGGGAPPAAIVVVPVLAASPATPSPEPRPADLTTAALDAPAQTTGGKKKKKEKSREGRICGDKDIKGEALAPITAKSKGCGLEEPVRVTEIAGVTLNPAATISCDTVEAMKTWVTKGLAPAFGKRKVIELRVAASYICRTRNNKKGAKVSEHGKGNAIDISAFVLSDGKILTVENDFGKDMRKAYKAACGIFGTTLGPGSDGFHEDHLHFDIARHNGGPYCR